MAKFLIEVEDRNAQRMREYAAYIERGGNVFIKTFAEDEAVIADSIEEVKEGV